MLKIALLSTQLKKDKAFSTDLKSVSILILFMINHENFLPKKIINLERVFLLPSVLNTKHITNFCVLVIKALSPLKLNNGNLPVVNTNTMQSSHPRVWCGGDVAGVAETTVEAVNDGKTAAWFMHCYLQVRSQISFEYLILFNHLLCA